MSKQLWLIAMLVMFAATTAHSESLRQMYVGRSGCSVELKTHPRGIRLDQSQRTRLRAYTVKGNDTLLIVQYKNDGDQCGVVRDIIQPRVSTNTFIWDCVDPTNPSAVVVGAWPVNDGRILGSSAEAWRIDLRKLQFIPLYTVLRFLPVNRAGADDGSDLARDAKKRK